MSENLKQSLSALMDNESDEFETRRTLAQLDDESAGVWSRYQLASSALKGEKPDGKLDLSAGVMAALESEPTPKALYRPRRHYWKPFASVAVAASVTAMVIFGAQSFQQDVSDAPVTTVASNSQIVLPGPSPMAPSLLPAQYGNSRSLALPADGAEPDVIRLSYGMERYINQHHALMRSRQKSWTANWLPEGFSTVRHEVMPDSEVILYSNGRTAISVSVEPWGSQKTAAGAVQSGDTVALGKRVGTQFVTVVGEVPLMIADRIASSVDRSGG